MLLKLGEASRDNLETTGKQSQIVLGSEKEKIYADGLEAAQVKISCQRIINRKKGCCTDNL